jgi:hypothetical protein
MYFVAVFGNPEPDKDPVDSGFYRADQGYPPFRAEPGDVLLLYCTDEYPKYRMQVPGIGIVLRATSDTVEYRWLPLSEPIRRETILEKFDPDDSTKMNQLGIKARRLFEISKSSFAKTLAG